MRSLISIDFPAPKMGTRKRTCGISCLRSLAPMWRLRCSTTQATFTNPLLLRTTPLLRAPSILHLPTSFPKQILTPSRFKFILLINNGID